MVISLFEGCYDTARVQSNQLLIIIPIHVLKVSPGRRTALQPLLDKLLTGVCDKVFTELFTKYFTGS